MLDHAPPADHLLIHPQHNIFPGITRVSKLWSTPYFCNITLGSFLLNTYAYFTITHSEKPPEKYQEPTGERYKNTGNIQNSFKICKLAPNDQWPIFGLPHVLNPIPYGLFEGFFVLTHAYEDDT